MIEETAHPGRVNQGNRGTCTMTSVSYLLAKNHPAEYARLAAGMMSPSGTARLANGETLRRVEDSIAPDDNKSRSPSERLLQSALMDFADGSKTYSNRDDRSHANGTRDPDLRLVRAAAGNQLSHSTVTVVFTELAMKQA